MEFSKLVSLPRLALLIWLLSAIGCYGDDQVFLDGNGRQHTKVYNVSFGFDDLHTNKHGVGYRPKSPKQEALQYKSVYIQGFSVVDVSKADLPDRLDLDCAASAPNALFGKVKKGYPWPRISLSDTSKPFVNIKKTQRTFALADISIKPTGIVPGHTNDGYVTIDLTMVKLPPDPIEGVIGNEGAMAGDIFPGLLQGSPAWTHRTSQKLLLGFFPGTHHPFRITPLLWFGEDWGKGMDVLEITATSAVLVNTTTNEWRNDPWEFCLDDVVLQVTETKRHTHAGVEIEVEGETESIMQRAPGEGVDALHITTQCALVGADGQLVDPNSMEFARFSQAMGDLCPQI